MGLQFGHSAQSFFCRLLRTGFHCALILALTLPQARGGDPVISAATGGSGGQAGALQQNANTNSLASNLGKAAGVLSMAAGGLYMAKGAEQMKCCASGCSGSGDSSKKTKDKIDEDTKKKSGGLLSTQACPRVRSPLPFLDFLRPTPADAAIGACLDAMIALATGGLMLVNGMLALQAANQSGQMAANGFNNAATMGSATAPTPAGGNGPENSKLGSTGTSSVRLDPALLRTGTANSIMGQFEKKFGIPRDQFAQAVLDGQDPRKLLGAAPLNPLSNTDMNTATNGAKGMSAADKEKALAGTELSAAQKELAGKLDDKYAINGAGGGTGSNASSFRKPANLGEDAPPADEGGKPSDVAMAISPDVKDALAAKELEDRRNGITDLTIFEVVHAKYREKSKMIFGYDPDGTSVKGGAPHGI